MKIRKLLSRVLVGALLAIQLQPILGLVASAAESVYVEGGKITVTNEVSVFVVNQLPTPADFRPKVLEVRSVNNLITDARWRPTMAEIPQLGPTLMDGSGERIFANAYVGFWDLNYSPVKRPTGGAQRAYEVLGYDILTKNESAYRSGDAYKWRGSDITKVDYEAAVMGLYKAMGQQWVEITPIHYKDSHKTVSETPAIAGMPGYMLDAYVGEAYTFVTRSNAEHYMNRARADGLQVGHANMELTYSDFLLLAQKVMHIYGEPVMSRQEMTALLQLYGAVMPSNLSTEQQEAYLYLKARGVLNFDFVWFDRVTIEHYLDLLMCIKDPSSRTNFKEIQPTMEIPTELQQAGYFPAEVEIAENRNAISVETNITYNYTTAYNYLVYITDESLKFVDSNKQPIQSLRVNVGSMADQEAVPGASFEGYLEDGAYHFIIPYDTPYDEVYINTSSVEDRPAFWILPAGGGTYRYSNHSNGQNGAEVQFARTAFKPDEYEGFVDQERKAASEEFTEEKAKQEIIEITTPPSEVAEEDNPVEEDPEILENEWMSYKDRNPLMFEVEDGSTTTPKTPSASDATRRATNVAYEYLVFGAQELDKKDVVTNNSVMGVVFSSTNGEQVIAGVTTNSPDLLVDEAGTVPAPITETLTKHSGIATMTGSTMVDVDELKSRTVKAEGKTVPLILDVQRGTDEDQLLLYSHWGIIKLNRKTREIVVGNTLYQIPPGGDTQIWVESKKDGKTVTLVDFRAVWGWAADSIQFNVYGGNGSARISIKEPSNITFNDRGVNNWVDFGQQAVAPQVRIHGTDELLMTNSYPAANWMMLHSYDFSTGAPQDYVAVFYPKEAKTGRSQWEELYRIIGYRIWPKGTSDSNESQWEVRIQILDDTDKKAVGKITWAEEKGWIYTMPTAAQFDFKKYLNGEYLLPISQGTSDMLIDWNTDVYSSDKASEPANTDIPDLMDRDADRVKAPTVSEYGFVPYYGRGYENWENNTTGGYSYSTCNVIEWVSPANPGTDFTSSDDRVRYLTRDIGYSFKVKPAPAGVNVYFGEFTTQRKEVKDFEGNYLNDTTVNIFYFGSRQILVRKSGTGVIHGEYRYTGNPTWFTMVLNGSDLVHETNRYAKSRGFYVFGLGEWTISNSIIPPDRENERTVLQYIDDEQKDKFMDHKGWSLQRFIDLLDNLVSLVVLIALNIMPLVGFILVTILIGLTFLADGKIVKWIFNKYFDPIKWVTMGKRNVNNIQFTQAVVYCLIAYIAFALIYNGNLLRIIMWILEGFGTILEIMKSV